MLDIVQLALALVIGWQTAKFTKKHQLSSLLGMALVVALTLLVGAIFSQIGGK
jgi:small basic protein